MFFHAETHVVFGETGPEKLAKSNFVPFTVSRRGEKTIKKANIAAKCNTKRCVRCVKLIPLDVQFRGVVY